jgi:hypothetical protein
VLLVFKRARPRPVLWAARVSGQVFFIEQHMHVISDGPGIVVSSVIPDFHCFNGRGGRTLPFLHPDETPNLAPGLTGALSHLLGHGVAATDVLAYIIGVVSHPGYTRTFVGELGTPGIRVPDDRQPGTVGTSGRPRRAGHLAPNVRGSLRR